MSRPLLLVEDAPNDIELALYALRKCGVRNEIVPVQDGQQALDYLLLRGDFAGRAAGPPRLVLLDLKLPRVDGIQVLQTIRDTPGLTDIAVVVLTASNLEADVERTMTLGIDRHIVKPMETAQFVAHMCELARRYSVH